MNIPSPIKKPLIAIMQALDREVHADQYGGKRIPVAEALRQNEIALQQRRSLGVTNWKTAARGKGLSNRYLAGVLAEDELGRWALDIDTLNFLEREIKAKKPTAIVEFGAGVSTICFARYLKEVGHQPPMPCVFSIEENEWQAAESKRRLEQLGLAQYVHIIYAPVTAQTIEGVETECYTLSPQTLAQFFRTARPDFIVVDGPSGGRNFRFGTVPLIKDYVDADAVFYLDDARRPEEMAVAKLWGDLPYLTNLQLCFVGKGMLIGTVSAEVRKVMPAS